MTEIASSINVNLEPLDGHHDDEIEISETTIVGRSNFSETIEITIELNGEGFKNVDLNRVSVTDPSGKFQILDVKNVTIKSDKKIRIRISVARPTVSQGCGCGGFFAGLFKLTVDIVKFCISLSVKLWELVMARINSSDPETRSKDDSE